MNPPINVEMNAASASHNIIDSILWEIDNNIYILLIFIIIKSEANGKNHKTDTAKRSHGKRA